MKDIITYKRLISLGAYCLPKFQINRHIAYKYLGYSENSTLLADRYLRSLPKADVEAINGGNYLFDWVVVENYNKLIELLKGGLDYKLRAGSLEERRDDQGDIVSIACQRSGIIWHHLFPRKDGGVTNDWRNEIGRLGEKIDHLRKKFLSLAEYQTLYVAVLSPTHIHNGIAVSLAYALAELRQNDKFALVIGVPVTCPL